MKKDNKQEVHVNAINKALAYLESRNALGKGNTQVIGRDICIWMPHRQSSLAFDLPKLSLK